MFCFAIIASANKNGLDKLKVILCLNDVDIFFLELNEKLKKI